MKFLLFTVLLLAVALSTQDSNSGNNNVIYTSGGCTYVNGKVYWNGTSRPANDSDKKLIKDYQAAYDEYQKQFQNNLSIFLSNMFGGLRGLFGNGDNNLQVPNLPSAPCFCAKQFCSSD